jgi:hypothetical protein
MADQTPTPEEVAAARIVQAAQEHGQLLDDVEAAITRERIASAITEAVAREREACAKVAESHAINARRIADKWTPGAISADGNVRTVAYWSTHEKAATDISAAIRARQP